MPRLALVTDIFRKEDKILKYLVSLWFYILGFGRLHDTNKPKVETAHTSTVTRCRQASSLRGQRTESNAADPALYMVAHALFFLLGPILLMPRRSSRGVQADFKVCGRPSFEMSRSFRSRDRLLGFLNGQLKHHDEQVLAQLDLLRYRKEPTAYKDHLYLLPKQLGEKVRNCAFLHSVRRSISPFRNGALAS